MKNRKSVVVAMSGGVDSSVAAARLVDEGYKVTGVHLALSKENRIWHKRLLHAG